MIDPNCFDGEEKPRNSNFIWFAFFLIASALMFGLAVNGFVALIKGESCDKKEVQITQPIKDINNEI